MCRYAEICPAYDKRSEKCNNILFDEDPPERKCVPLLLEAYHDAKGTNYGCIRKYLP